MESTLHTDTHRVLLFDGVCNLCNAVVQFVLKHDHRKRLRFASLQSAYGQATLRQLSLPTDTLNTFVYERGSEIHTQSTAFLYLMRDLGGAFRLFEVLWVVPRILRDAVYRMVARSRYSMFGKRNACYVPTPALKDRFIS